MTQDEPVPVLSDGFLTGWRRARSLVFLVVLSVSTVHDQPLGELSTGQVVAMVTGDLAGIVSWLVMSREQASAGLRTAAVAGCMATGLWLTAWLPDGASPAYLAAAVAIGAARLPFRRAVTLTGGGALGLAAVLALHGRSWSTISLWTGGLAVILLIGLVRKQRVERDDERARAESLADRAHVAREIHDVLAHSLSALSVQLETAAALLERDRTAEAAVIVDRAGRLARDGLTETRRAVGALRGDPIPLPELIAELAAGYREDHPAGAELAVEGEPRDLTPEAGLVLYRAAQEALANVRKHAPGSAVALRLTYEKDAVSLGVGNGGADRPPLTGLSSGYGLMGLRERAELAGGTAGAGPSGDGWRVDVRIPA